MTPRNRGALSAIVRVARRCRQAAILVALLLGLGTHAMAVSTPIITSPTSANGQQGVDFAYQITAIGVPAPFSFGASGLPSGLAINTATGAITGKPTVYGTYNVSIGAFNGQWGMANLALTILEAPPVITSSGTATGQLNHAFLYQITASNDPTSFGASPMPPGLVFAGSTISGTPTTLGTYSITLSASNAGGTGTKTLTLTVNPDTPVITSATNASGNALSPFSYQITATNSPTSYNATGLPQGVNVSTSTGLISGTPGTVGTYTVTLSATNAGGTGTATLTLLIEQPIPVIFTSLTANGQVGQPFSYTIGASNNPTSFNATGLPTGLSVNTSSGIISGTPAAGTAGTYAVPISATNSGGTGTATLSLTIAPAAPVITSSLTATGQVSHAFSYQITASNSPTSFNATNLPAGLSVNTATGVISGTPTTPGQTWVTISATNAGGTGSASLSITVNPLPPVITSSITASGQTGNAFSYQITATNNPTSFGATGLPGGLSVNTGTGAITGTPTATGTFSVPISATNSGGTGSATLTLTITAGKPAITSALTASGQVGSAFTYQITATNSPTSYGASGLPSGLSVNTSTGAITGTPTAAGTSSVTISATNGEGTGSATLTLTVLPAKPVITSPLTASGSTGNAFSYQITATNSPTSYDATGLPAGLVVNTSSGVISGTPTTAGTTVMTVKAINAGGTGTASVTVTITQTIGQPAITSSLSANAQVGSAFSYQITATNSPTSFGASGLQAGLSVNTTTGAITGTPTASGTASVVISATNSAGTGSATLVLTVKPATPVITSALTADGLTTQAFSYQITATSSPTSFGASPLPAGLVVNTSTGVISGTPTAVGTTAVTITATNAGGTGSASLTVTITAPSPPAITSPLTATATVGLPFSYQISASHAPTSYGASGLPTGLVVNTTTGVITGTVSAPVTKTFTVSATNIAGTGSATVTFTAAMPQPPDITSGPSATATVGNHFSFQIAATNTPTSYSASGLPAGLVVAHDTGVISGTPSDPGVTTVVLSAANAAGTATQDLRLMVVPATGQDLGWTSSSSCGLGGGPVAIAIALFACMRRRRP
jgi:hypothetical protein